MKYISILAIFIFVSCSADPYQGTSTGPIKEKVEEVKAPQLPDPQPLPSLSLSIPDIMEFEEGINSNYAVLAVVNAGVPVLSVTGMPAGMIYDAAKEQISWKPGFSDANDPTDPASNKKIFSLEFNLYSDAEPKNFLTKTVLVIVKDKSRAFGFESPLGAELMEGNPFEHLIKIKDFDFPNGPFMVRFKNLPTGVEWNFPDPSTLSLKMLASYSLVKNADFKDLLFGLEVINPRGAVLPGAIKWTVKNQTVSPSIWGISEIRKFPDITFSLISEDLNGETAPSWQLPSVPFGNLEATEINTINQVTKNPVKMLNVVWSKVPNSEKGKSQRLNFRSCVRGSYCSDQSINIIFR